MELATLPTWLLGLAVLLITVLTYVVQEIFAARGPKVPDGRLIATFIAVGVLIAFSILQLVAFTTLNDLFVGAQYLVGLVFSSSGLHALFKNGDKILLIFPGIKKPG